jgi:hypothetical protein
VKEFFLLPATAAAVAGIGPLISFVLGDVLHFPGPVDTIIFEDD